VERILRDQQAQRTLQQLWRLQDISEEEISIEMPGLVAVAGRKQTKGKLT